MRVNLFQKFTSQTENLTEFHEVFQRLLLGILAPFIISIKSFGKVSFPRAATRPKSHPCCRQIFFRSLFQSRIKAIDDQLILGSIKSSDKLDIQFIHLISPFGIYVPICIKKPPDVVARAKFFTITPLLSPRLIRGLTYSFH